jgi:hypothetical protein
VRRLVPGLAILAAGLLAGTGCGDNSTPNVVLSTSVQWNRDPSSVDQIGYQVWVDIGWPDRPQTCFPLSPDLRIQVNDLQAVPMDLGACVFDVLVKFGAFLQDVPIDVRLTDGDRTIAEAQYQGLFPGTGVQVLDPAGGQVHAGDPITLSLPVASTAPPSVGGLFYWLQAAPSVQPFYSQTEGTCSTDGRTVQITAPGLTGSAELAIDTPSSANSVSVISCVGFQTCGAQTDDLTEGPVSIQVIP